jgi:aldehyde dehydrogenase (NAD+)
MPFRRATGAGDAVTIGVIRAPSRQCHTSNAWPLRMAMASLALEAGFPPGVLNVVPGLGTEAGAALAAHPGIDHIAFTGSREVGSLVMAAAAVNIVPVALELGGKSPQVVFSDCDLDAAVPSIVSSIIEHAGQNCSAGSRVLVERGTRGRLVDALAEAFGAIRIGPGSADLDMGPLISEAQRDRVLGYIRQGQLVARLVTGGGIPAAQQLAGGFFVQPTIFDEVPPESSIAQEEIFGPVLSVLEFSDAAEAVALANGTSFGLAAGVWTNRVNLAHWLAAELRVSQVFVNNYAAAGGVELPFGGCKKSGFGREKGFTALHEYTRTKAIAVHTGLT